MESVGDTTAKGDEEQSEEGARRCCKGSKSKALTQIVFVKHPCNDGDGNELRLSFIPNALNTLFSWNFHKDLFPTDNFQNTIQSQYNSK